VHRARHIQTPLPLAPWGEGSVPSNRCACPSMGSVCVVGVARPCLPSEPVDELGVRCTVPVATMKPRVRKSVSGGGAILAAKGSTTGLCQPALAWTGLQIGSNGTSGCTLLVAIDISYVALQADGIVNVALHRQYSPGIIFIFSQGRKDRYHV
jgi:hypothetical protein